jgi:hypothetical protein
MAIDTTKMRVGGAYEGDQRAKLPVYDAGSGSGNSVLTMNHPMRELYIANDSITDDLILQVTGDSGLDISITLKPEDWIDERFPEFSTVTITAVGNWRWYVRSGRVT